MNKKVTDQDTQLEAVADTLLTLISHYEAYHSSMNQTIHMDALYKMRLELQTAFPQIG